MTKVTSFRHNYSSFVRVEEEGFSYDYRKVSGSQSNAAIVILPEP